MSKRLWSYRSGDLKEDLGLVLLGGIGAVAPVAREEDVGIDAIVTIYRPASRLLFAQESFYVQLKSSNVTEFVLESDDVEWLRLIALPLFIGLVEGTTGMLSLYSVNRIWEFFVVDEKYQSITIQFCEGPVEDGAPRAIWVASSDKQGYHFR